LNENEIRVVRKVCLISFSIFVIVMLGFPLLYRIFYYQGIQERENNLRSEFQAIVHISGAQQLKLKISGKIVERDLWAIYKYDIPDEEVEKYYDIGLSQEGWTKQGTIIRSNKRFRGSIYKKGLYEISINPYEDKDEWMFILSYKDFFGKHML